MSFRLAAISLYLRFWQKPRLARLKSPEEARAAFERIAARLFRTPPDTNVIEDRIDGPAGPLPVEWISRGRPDRLATALVGSGRHRPLSPYTSGIKGRWRRTAFKTIKTKSFCGFFKIR